MNPIFVVMALGSPCCSVALLCPILWLHGLQHTRLPCPSLFLPEFAQTHVGDAIQPSHPRFPPSSLALNLSQHQGLFQWVDSLNQVAKVLELQLQPQSFQWIFRIYFLLWWTGWSPCSWRNSQESSPHHSSKASNLQSSAQVLESWDNKKKSMTTVAGKGDSIPCTENSAADNLWPPLLCLRRAFMDHKKP